VSRPIPTRYERHPSEWFTDAIHAKLCPGMAILDIGSGRRPALASAHRPAGARYVGLDLSAAELARAPADAYDERIVADIAEPVERLRGQFDLIVSWQVLEHVRDMERALHHARCYLRPGGSFVALLSGRYSVNGVLNAALPPAVSVWLMRCLLGRDPESVFPAYYDGCTHGDLRRLMSDWTDAAIAPLYLGGSYFNFSLPLRDFYLAYESWACRTRRLDLATHYLVDAAC
jgi:SAM-dependent methyltransferase